MFGPRRRPILGAAVLVGASRSAARHEVKKQGQQNSEMEMAAERAADQKIREEAEMERRTQLAIDEAIIKERSRVDNEARAPPYVAVGPAGYNVGPAAGQVEQNVHQGYGGGANQGVKSRYCSSCGHACQDRDRFCSGCGQQQPIPEEGPWKGM